MAELRPVDHHTRVQLNEYLIKIEEILEADLLTIYGQIMYGLEHKVKYAIELFKKQKGRIAVILDTPGGVVEVVERLVSVIRHNYDGVDFLIPDRAMSAGTVFVMAGDRVFMGYFSCLGPIDPQIEKDGKLVPALSYLNQYQRLHAKAETGQLNTAELVLLDKFDPGELYQFEQARELSTDLLTDWLSTYRFKNWKTDAKTKAPQADDGKKQTKKQRAKKIAAALSDNERWRSHGRMISRDTLLTDPKLRLKMDKLEDIPDLSPALDDYFGLLRDFLQKEQYPSFVHTREYF